MSVSALSKDERIFLAGCMKSMILADGSVAPTEVEELDRLIKRLEFGDFEKSLEDFDAQIKDTETFWEKAETISSNARALILSVLEELALFEGIPQPVERALLDQLRDAWASE